MLVWVWDWDFPPQISWKFEQGKTQWRWVNTNLCQWAQIWTWRGISTITNTIQLISNPGFRACFIVSLCLFVFLFHFVSSNFFSVHPTLCLRYREPAIKLDKLYCLYIFCLSDLTWIYSWIFHCHTSLYLIYFKKGFWTTLWVKKAN